MYFTPFKTKMQAFFLIFLKKIKIPVFSRILAEIPQEGFPIHQNCVIMIRKWPATGGSFAY
jgi:hypothetical protein